MNNKILILVLITFSLCYVNACQSSNTQYQRFYLTKDLNPSFFSNHQVNVVLNETLDQGGIAIELSDVNMFVASENRWANNLSDQLSALMYSKIQNISYFKDKHVNLYFSEFNGSYDGLAKVAFFVSIIDDKNKVLFSKDYRIQNQVKEDGYTPLVRELKISYIALIDKFINDISVAKFI